MATIVLLLILGLLLTPCTGTSASVEELKQTYDQLDSDVVEHWKAYVANNPRDPWGQHYLGLALFEAGLFSQADQALQEAARLEPQRALHQLQLANFYWRRGSPRSALRHFRAAEELEENSQRRDGLRQTQQRLQALIEGIDQSASRQRTVSLILLVGLCVWPVRALMARTKRSG